MMKVYLFLLILQAVYGLSFDSKQTDAPWFVYLNILGLRCGGTLVHNKFVITAAHCFDGFFEEHTIKEVNYIDIYFGEWKLKIDPDCEDAEDSSESCEPVALVRAENLTIHEKYNKNNKDKHDFDIAVIELKRPPKISEITDNALLPDEECNTNLTGQPLTVSGFGETEPQKFADIRKKIDFTVFSDKKCKTEYSKNYNSKVHFCGAGKNGIATCKGDSGGGAVSQTEDEDGQAVGTLKGIVTFGSDVCNFEKSSGFLKVSCFIDWINAIVNPGAIKRSTTTTTSTSTTTEKSNDSEDDDF